MRCMVIDSVTSNAIVYIELRIRPSRMQCI